MGFSATEPQRAHGSGPDIAQEIRDSFQAVLDALDAARADLDKFDKFDEPEAWAECPPPSGRQRGEPATDAGSTHPPLSLPSPPTPPPPPPTISPPVVEPPRTGGPRQVGAPQEVVVEPLWLRGAQLEPALPPRVGKPRMAGGAGTAHATPPVTFLPPAPLHEGTLRGTVPRPDTTRSAAPQRPVQSPDRIIDLPSKTSRAPARAHARNSRRRSFIERLDTRLAGVLGGVAVSGSILFSSLLVNDNPQQAVHSSPSGQLERPLPDNPAPKLPEIPGTGVLRQGDSGHGVYELQVRLLQVPDIYEGGAVSGRYDREVQAAVTRFQERYGIRGDESGVYGNHTRLALMLRTT